MKRKKRKQNQKNNAVRVLTLKWDKNKPNQSSRRDAIEEKTTLSANPKLHMCRELIPHSQGVQRGLINWIQVKTTRNDTNGIEWSEIDKESEREQESQSNGRTDREMERKS